MQPPATRPSPPRSPPDAPVLALAGRVVRADALGLCVRVRALLEAGATAVVCDVGAIAEPDVETVDVLARMQLTARRFGRRIRLRRANGDLEELLRLIGLDEALPCGPSSALEPRG